MGAGAVPVAHVLGVSGRRRPVRRDRSAYARGGPARGTGTGGGFGRAECRAPAAGETECGREAGEADCGCAAGEIPISGTRAERYQVMLHVEPETLRADGEPGLSELEDGTRVSQETSRRLSCDASVVRVSHARDGSILEVGRKTRIISPALRRALEVRDRAAV